MKKKKINPKIMIPWMLLPCFILLFQIRVQAKEIIVNDSGDLRQVVETASDGDIIIIEGSPTVNDDNSDSSPWVINKAITIKGKNNNSEINLRAGGIILGNHVTFENITLSFLNSTRNVIAANGYTLTLKNTTSSSLSQQMHLVCGTMYSSSGKVASANIPTVGTHGKIIVTSTKDVSIGNIYAGNLSTTGEAAPSTIPATIDIDVTTNSKIGLSHTHPTNNITVEAGIYGTGASETVGPGLSFDTNHVQLPPIPSIIHKVTGAVTMNIKGTAVKKLDGETGGTTNATFVFKGHTYAILGTTELRNFEIIHIENGKFGPKSTSDLSNTKVKVSQTGKIIFSYMNNPQINRLEGSESGTIVIGKNQTLSITDTVVGQTKVSIEEHNSDISSMPVLDNHIYIDAKNSVEDSFLMWPYMNNKRIQLFLEEGKWYAKVGETVITIESISIENKEGNTAENFKELPVNVILTDNEGELNQIPMEISCNGVPMTGEEDKGSYSYKTSDNTLEVFFTYSTYGKDVLMVSIPIDSDENLQAGTYRFTLQIPAKHMANKQNKTLEAKLTVVDPSGATPLTFTDDASYDLLSLKKGEEISPIDISKGVLGGISPYSYQASGLPEGITIGTDTGIITGSPTKEGEEGTATITVTDSKQVTASITIAVGAVTGEVTEPPQEITYPITVVADPIEGGTVEQSLQAAKKDQQVVVKATPKEGWKFAGWESAEVEIDNPLQEQITVIMPEKEITIRGKFEKEEIIVPEEPLTFMDHEGYDLPSMKVGTKLQEINLMTAVSGGAKPYQFTASGLPEGITIGTDTGIITGSPTKEGEEGTATITVTDSKQATASITIAVGAVTGEVIVPPQEITYPITVVADPVEGGTVEQSLQTAPKDQQVVVKASAKEGWKFAGWESEEVEIDDPLQEQITVIMPEKEITIRGKFEKEEIIVPEEPLTFMDHEGYDLPSMKVGTKLQEINLMTAVSGGVKPYQFTASGLPEGITIGTDTGIITGSPTKEGEEGTATITVTDSKQATASITIAVGAVTEEVTVPPTEEETKPTPGGSTPPAAGNNSGQGGGSTPPSAGNNSSQGGGSTPPATGNNSSQGGGSTPPAAGNNSSQGGGSTPPAAGSNSSQGGGNTPSAAGNNSSQGGGSTPPASKENSPSVIGGIMSSQGKQKNEPKSKTEGVWGEKKDTNDKIPKIIWEEKSKLHEIYDKTGQKYWLYYEIIPEKNQKKIWELVEENDEIKEALPNYSAYEILEVHLRENNSSKKVQPKGEVTFLIEYPEKAEESFSFILIHLKENKFPILLKENEDYRKTTEGILVTTENFSPFIVGWKEVSLEDGLGEEIKEQTKEQQEKEEPIASGKQPEAKEEMSSLWLLLSVIVILLIIAAGAFLFVKQKREEQQQNSKD